MFSFGQRPTRRRRGKQPADPATKQRLRWEDVQEDKPQLAAFLKAREEAKARAANNSDLNFWVCLVFQSQAQKLEFLEAVKDVPVLYNVYADGEQFAERVGIKVTPNQFKPINSPLHKKLTELVESKTLAERNEQKIKAAGARKGSRW